MKKLLILILLGALLGSAVSCTAPNGENDNTSGTTDHVASENTSGDDTVKALTIDETYVITRPENNDPVTEVAVKLNDTLTKTTGLNFKIKDDWFKSTDEIPEKEIIVGNCDREEAKSVYEALGPDEWKIVVSDQKIIIAGESVKALRAAVSCFISEYVKGPGSFEINTDIELCGAETARELIVSSISKLRDPCILYEEGVYYAYGTDWVCYKNTSGDLEGPWKRTTGILCRTPADADGNKWAPEVYKYNGAFYMFTTYKSASTGHRGCTVMRSDKPDGQFVEISGGHITPKAWDAIDGSLYIDRSGQPWMVFVHEWTSTDDGIGRMAAAKMSDDLTKLISEPIELFRADDAAWAKNHVTDGCWMYRCENGELLMLWSSTSSSGYSVGIARSDNGEIDGKWTHDTELLYSKEIAGDYDGGHGMVFADRHGKLWLAIHSPNSASSARQEKPIFVPIREENGTLVWDVTK